MNPMKYYVDENGTYLGGWDASPPAGAIEVPHPPGSATQIWSFDSKEWEPVPNSDDEEKTPLQKLSEFLSKNPDVLELISL